jgi:MATE family multidrug resistance protein
VSSPLISAALADNPRASLVPMLRLAGPVVLAEIGWMSMGLVDTIMVAGLGPEAIGAVGVGSTIFLSIAIFGMGLLLGLDTLVAQAFGADRLDECHRWLLHGACLAALVSLPLTALAFTVTALLAHGGLHPDVALLMGPYLRIVSTSLPVLLLYAACRRYLQGLGIVRPIMVALVTANLVNLCVNWLLIEGRLGAPALGTAGAAWATVISRLYMVSCLVAAIWLHDRSERHGLADTPLEIEWARIARLFHLGVPAAGQVTLEVGVFAVASALAARLEPVALAAHQIALNIASLSFMVPLGIASAGAVMVGHAVGRRDPRGAGRAGWTALVIAAAFMSVAALSFLIAPRLLLGIFTTDPMVLSIGTTLLFVASIFQLFDGLQVVGTGVLRGLGDTRTPMALNLAGHWLFGLPVGYTLCFVAGWGVTGLWVGLSAGLTLVGVVLVWVWARRARRLGAELAPIAQRDASTRAAVSA